MGAFNDTRKTKISPQMTTLTHHIIIISYLFSLFSNLQNCIPISGFLSKNIFFFTFYIVCDSSDYEMVSFTDAVNYIAYKNPVSQMTITGISQLARASVCTYYKIN